jgi:hypothetical protein
MILGMFFFELSAMQIEQLSLKVHMCALLQCLVKDKDVGENSIIIFPVQTENAKNEQLKRIESQRVLSKIALKGVDTFLNSNSAVTGTTFLIATNRVDINQTDSTCSEHGLLRKKTRTKILKKEVHLDSLNADKASFVVYNMPYYNKNGIGFNGAYGCDFFECIYQKKAPCLVLMDEDIYDHHHQEYNMHELFNGNKKIFLYDTKSGILKKYNYPLFTETSCCIFSFGVLWSALLLCGYFS